MSFNGTKMRNMYSLNTISDRKRDTMRSMNLNVPQNGLITNCSSGSKILESHLFPSLLKRVLKSNWE